MHRHVSPIPEEGRAQLSSWNLVRLSASKLESTPEWPRYSRWKADFTSLGFCGTPTVSFSNSHPGVDTALCWALLEEQRPKPGRSVSVLKLLTQCPLVAARIIALCASRPGFSNIRNCSLVIPGKCSSKLLSSSLSRIAAICTYWYITFSHRCHIMSWYIILS